MNVVGIVAEYNPFHSGHAYLLSQAREKAQAEGTLVVMSGNFVQRGEPALVDKWSRTEMALAEGADLVLELPVLYATRSAYWFALGGLLTLFKTGLVTHLAFGTEEKEPDNLLPAARLLAHETDSFRAKLKACLEEGLSFPQARSWALAKEFELPSSLWSKPNNILALAYLQVIDEKKLPFVPLPIPRVGSAYHDPSFTADALPSATALRSRLLREKKDPLASLEHLRLFLPHNTTRVLRREFSAGRGPVFLESLAPQLMSFLRRARKQDLREIVDVAEGLENRIVKAAQTAQNPPQFLEQLKTKRYTYSRLQRFLLHLFLGYTREKALYLEEGPPYLHVLGFTSQGRVLLNLMKKQSVVPIITKGAHAHRFARQNAVFSNCWEMDVLSTNLYTLLYPAEEARVGNLDYLKAPVYHCSSDHEEQS